MKTFIDLVSIYSKQLQIEDWCQLVFDDKDSQQKLTSNKQEFINTKRAECMQISTEDLDHLLRLLDESARFEIKEKEKVTECLTKFILPFILNGTIQFHELIKPKLVDLLNEPESMENIQEERFIPHLEF